MRNFKSSQAMLFTTMLLSATAGYAQDSGIYLGLGAGLLNADFDRPAVAHLDYAPFSVNTGPGGPGFTVQSVNLVSASQDDSASTLEAFAGYRFNPYWALELSYHRFSDVDAQIRTTETTTTPQIPGTFSQERDVKTSGKSANLALSLLGTLPFDNGFSLLGLIGLVYSDADMQQRDVLVAANGGISSPDYSHSAQNTSVVAGIGIGYRFSQQLSLRVLYRYYPDMIEQV